MISLVIITFSLKTTFSCVVRSTPSPSCHQPPHPPPPPPLIFRSAADLTGPLHPTLTAASAAPHSSSSATCLVAPLPTKPLPRGPLLQGAAAAAAAFSPLHPFFYRPYMPRTPFTIPGKTASKNIFSREATSNYHYVRPSVCQSIYLSVFTSRYNS